MHSEILIVAVILALVAYLAWLLSPPGAPKPFVSADKDIVLKENITQPESRGNDIRTFTAFSPMVSAMEQDIRSARSYVHLSFFKFEDDAVGRRLAGLMAEKAAQGVEVRLLVDWAVCAKYRSLYKEMEADGISVKLFSPIAIPFLRKSDNYRYHRKIVVIDGLVAYIGGMNIADRYGEGLSWGQWRDTHIRITGTAVPDCEYAFARDWAYGDGDLLSDAKYYPKVAPTGSTGIDIVCSGPRGEGPAVMTRLCDIIDRSERYAWLESPYLIPTKEVQDSLFRAASRGVDVRIIIPPRSDRGWFTPLASKSYIAGFLDAGVKIAEYGKGFMHSKTIVCDDRYVSVGSTNIDPRSYILDYEINAFMDDPSYASVMKDIFIDDEQGAHYIDKDEWARRSLPEKTGEAFSKLLSAQL